MKLQFRPMRPEDAADLAALAKEADPYAWSLTGFLQAAKAGKYVELATSDGVLVGFYVLGIVLDEAELEDIAVRPSFQGQGIGTALLTEALKTAKLSAVRLVRLEVRVGNAVARHLYEKNGFVAERIRCGYYRSLTGREDALLMTKCMTDCPLD